MSDKRPPTLIHNINEAAKNGAELDEFIEKMLHERPLRDMKEYMLIVETRATIGKLLACTTWYESRLDFYETRARR
jgi:hypothetical protein